MGEGEERTGSTGRRKGVTWVRGRVGQGATGGSKGITWVRGREGARGGGEQEVGAMGNWQGHDTGEEEGRTGSKGNGQTKSRDFLTDQLDANDFPQCWWVPRCGAFRRTPRCPNRDSEKFSTRIESNLEMINAKKK